MNIITIGGVDIDLHSSPVGVSLSGGADSAILAGILMKYMEGDIHFYTINSLEKRFKTSEHSIKIINFLSEKYKKYNVYHHLKYVKNQTRDNLLTYLYGAKDRCGVMYTATTSVPAAAEMSQFTNKLSDDILARRDPSSVKKIYSDDRYFYSPFYNLTKKEIFNLYVSMDLLEDLYPLTRSCESTTVVDQHCGVCWWCEERRWAFGKV